MAPSPLRQLDIIGSMEQELEILKGLPFFMQTVSELTAQTIGIPINGFSLLENINDLLLKLFKKFIDLIEEIISIPS